VSQAAVWAVGAKPLCEFVFSAAHSPYLLCLIGGEQAQKRAKGKITAVRVDNFIKNGAVMLC